MATFSAHTASPPPPSRTPAGSRASSRHASLTPRTTSGHGPLPWDARLTRTHRSITCPPTAPVQGGRHTVLLCRAERRGEGFHPIRPRSRLRRRPPRCLHHFVSH